MPPSTRVTLNMLSGMGLGAERNIARSQLLAKRARSSVSIEASLKLEQIPLLSKSRLGNITVAVPQAADLQGPLYIRGNQGYS